jgi:polysaccharide biosynthesis protein PslG
MQPILKLYDTLQPRLNSNLSALIIVLITFLGFSPLRAAAHEEPQQSTFYTVRGDDTWVTITARFLIPPHDLWASNGIVNPSRLARGQQIYVPVDKPDSQGQVVSSNRTPALAWAALRSGVPQSSLFLLNGISVPYFEPDRHLAAPASPEIAVGPAPTEVSTRPTAAPDQPSDVEPTPVPGTALRRSLLGIQGHFAIQEDERELLLDKVAYKLDFGWVKAQADWNRIEYAPGQYSVYLDDLDSFVDGAFNRELKVLLSVVKAPEWARGTPDRAGPPTDYNTYYNFLRFLIDRYRGKVQAIEVWNEPNLRHEWANGELLSGTAYVGLLAGAYEAIKTTDSSITVISAGLAPTGVNNDEAKNDRLYFREMYEAGLAQHTDVIGIHPYGWANPPWARCCGDAGGVPTHNNDPSFFFLNTVEDYRAIQAEFGDSDRRMWATEFGWGTMDGLGLPVPDEQPFFAYLDQGKQAEYIVAAFQIAQQWDFMGPMFLWNLNNGALDGTIDANQAGYSILGNEPDRPRAAYRALVDMPKSDD